MFLSLCDSVYSIFESMGSIDKAYTLMDNDRDVILTENARKESWQHNEAIAEESTRYSTDLHLSECNIFLACLLQGTRQNH